MFQKKKDQLVLLINKMLTERRCIPTYWIVGFAVSTLESLLIVNIWPKTNDLRSKSNAAFIFSISWWFQTLLLFQTPVIPHTVLHLGDMNDNRSAVTVLIKHDFLSLQPFEVADSFMILDNLMAGRLTPCLALRQSSGNITVWLVIAIGYVVQCTFLAPKLSAKCKGFPGRNIRILV